MGRKTIILNEEQTKLIIERITDRLWHFTQPSTIIAILKTDKIGLTFQQNRSDAYSNKHFYYLSASRTKTAFDNSWGYSKIARIELDGYELGKKYTGRPVNYYNASKGGTTPGVMERGLFEYEDRIISDQPFIPNATNYIKRIDLLLEDKDQEYRNKITKQYQEILGLAKQTGTPVYVYGNKKDYSIQSNNTINDQIESAHTADTEEDKPYKRTVDFINVITELFAVNYIITHHGKDPYNFWSQDTKTELENLLKKFNLEQYTDKVFSQIERKRNTPGGILDYGTVRSMSNASDFRQAHLTSQNTEDGENLQRLATYLMRLGKAKSIDILIANALNGKYDNGNNTQQQDTIQIVFYGNSYMNPRIIDGDKPMKELLNPYSELEKIRFALEDDDMYLQPGEETYNDYKRKVHHKSKNYHSLLKYLEKKFDEGNCTMKEYAQTMNKLFNNKESMEDALTYWYETRELDRQTFIENWDELNRIGGYDIYDIIDKLFGNFENFQKEYQTRNNNR